MASISSPRLFQPNMWKEWRKVTFLKNGDLYLTWIRTPPNIMNQPKRGIN